MISKKEKKPKNIIDLNSILSGEEKRIVIRLNPIPLIILVSMYVNYWIIIYKSKAEKIKEYIKLYIHLCIK